MSKLIFYIGTMASGKSTLALQRRYNLNQSGLDGLLFTQGDRAGDSTVSSRIGISAPAIEVDSGTDLDAYVGAELAKGRELSFVVCDEAQFYTPAQIDQLANIADRLGIDVYAFGLNTNFQTVLFPASKRLIELADEVCRVQSEAVCWCGRSATHNARLVDDVMVTEGAVVVVGDTNQGHVQYRVLCRKHHLAGQPFKTPSGD